MDKTGSSENIHVQIDGSVSGQLAIGNNILQIGEIHGGIVNIIAPDKKPNFTRKPRPLYIRPHAFPGLLNRTGELGILVSAVQNSEPVSIHGQNGLGKTALLRTLAYHSAGANFPDGLVYFPARGKAVEDLLQDFFDCFYESDRPAKPSEAQLHQLLQGVCALILLDDIELGREQVSELINCTPQCILIFASRERCLWGEGRCIQLAGLPTPEALTLIERELGHSLEAEERALAEAFCETVSGHPLYVLQGAACVRQGKSFLEVGDQFREPENTFAKTVLAEAADPQRRLLSILAASGNFPLSIDHLEAIGQVRGLDAPLKALQDLHLIQANSPSYHLTGSLALSLAKQTDLSDWENRVREYFVEWIKQNPPLPEVQDVLGMLLSLLEKADRDGRWQDVISLGRGLEKVLILKKRWQAWLQVLQWVLKAAHALGDRAAQGWALHELGTRNLCLGNLEPARQFLSDALRVREGLGDQAGAAVTRHNLSLVPAPPAPPRETPRSGPRPAPKAGAPPVLKAMLGFAGLVTVVVLGMLVWNASQPHPTSTPDRRPPIRTTKAIFPPVTDLPTEPPATTEPAPTTEVPPATEAPTEIQVQVCASGVWYCENFEDEVAQDFTLDRGWSIQWAGPGIGSNVLDGAGHQWAELANHAWEDYRLTFRLKLVEGAIRLLYRVAPGEKPIRYSVIFAEKSLLLTKQVGQDAEEVAGVEVTHARGEWHTVEIAGWREHIAVYVDGKLELEYIDPNFLPGGTFGFETFDKSQAQIDDIEVRAAGEEPDLSCEKFGQLISVTTETDFDRVGMDYWDGPALDPDRDDLQVCQDLCKGDPRCRAYTFVQANSHCWLKAGRPDRSVGPGLVSGLKVCVNPRSSFDIDGPLPPVIVRPKDKVSFVSPGDQVLLDWNKASDPSGIAKYQVEVEGFTDEWSTRTYLQYFLVNQGQPTEFDFTEPFQQCNCYTFQWRIRAQDQSGNWGDWSNPATFHKDVVVY